MASDSLDNLEEFFDFARLHSDNEDVSHVECFEEFSEQTFPAMDLDSVMEWQPSTYDAHDANAALPASSMSEAIAYTATGAFDTELVLPLQGAEDFSRQPQLAVAQNGGAYQWAPQDNTIRPELCRLPVLPAVIIPDSRTVQYEPTPQSQAQSVPQLRRPTLRGHKPASPRRKGPQSRIPLEARQILEDEFTTNPYPCNWEIDIIAHQVSLDVKQVRTWFNNTRARKKVADRKDDLAVASPYGDDHSLATKLSAESLEALSNEVDHSVAAPQPPLAVYLASSYLEEAAAYSDIQAAIDNDDMSDRLDTTMDSSTASRLGKSGSIISSPTCSSAPTSYTMSSSGSNISSFGRDRRRGRRRMTWRASPYGRSKVGGLDDSGTQSKDLPFSCTFCLRAFKTKYEWVRHEDSVHALRTTWICCNTKPGPLRCCPFCGELNPDEYHMASHKYQQCRNKPEQQRTFYRRDHFVQHLHHVHFANVKHPSARLGCQARMTASEGTEYGCKDLAVKWRRFGAPMRSNDPMLHCGFCGKQLPDWNARCEHVAEHLISGGFDRSAWWPERLQIHLENLCVPRTIGPFRCRYCQKVFANAEAMNKHSHCRVWSCRFLRTFDDVASESTAPPLCPQFPSPKAHHCHLCGAGYRSSHIEHAQQYHNYRLCKQDMYNSSEDFLQHLHEFHQASHPVLLQHNLILEQHFSRNKGASFEPVNFDEILQGCREATPTASFVGPFPAKRPVRTVSKDVEARPGTPASPPRRKTRERISDMTDIPGKVRRQHSLKDEEQKLEPPGPRFFRLDPLVPFLSSRLYYLRNAKMANLFSDGRALLEEVPQGHIASLVMSSGLVGMAGVRLSVQMAKTEEGAVEFALEDEE